MKSSARDDQIQKFFEIIDYFHEGTENISCPNCGSQLHFFEDPFCIVVTCSNKKCNLYGHVKKQPKAEI